MSTEASAAEFGDDEIFFGSVPVALAPAPGHCEVYDHASAALATNPDEVAVSRARVGKLTAGAYSNAVVPCMPCVDIRGPRPAPRELTSGHRDRAPRWH